MDLEANDKIFFQLYMKTYFKKKIGIDILNLNLQNPDIIASSQSFWPPHDPNWYKMNLSAVSNSGGANANSKSKSGKSEKNDEAAETKTPAKEVFYYITLETSF